jgi:hypothetical protein
VASLGFGPIAPAVDARAKASTRDGGDRRCLSSSALTRVVLPELYRMFRRGDEVAVAEAIPALPATCES